MELKIVSAKAGDQYVNLVGQTFPVVRELETIYVIEVEGKSVYVREDDCEVKIIEPVAA